MADFNPQLPPENVPNFTSFMYGARPIAEPKADASGLYEGKGQEDLFKGVGETLARGGEALDKVMHSVIDNKIYNQADEQRDAFTGALSYTKDQLTSDKGQPQPGSLKLMTSDPSNSDSAPAMVKNGLSDVDNLHSAYTGKKISETQYLSNLTTMAKNLRSQFPGYRDYIDERIHSVIGGTPANMLVRSYIQDIQTQLTQQQEGKNKILSQMYEVKGAPGWNAVMHNYTNGLISDDQVNNYLGNVSADKWNTQRLIDNAKAKVDTIQASKTEAKFQYQPALEHHVDSIVNQGMQAVFTGGGMHSVDDIIKAAQDQVSGKTHYTAEQWQAWKSQLDAATGRMTQDALNWANQTKITGNQTLTDAMGGAEEVNKIIAAKMEKAKAISGMIGNGDFPGAAAVANSIKAQHEDDQQKMLADPNLGPTFRLLGAVNKLAPSTVYSNIVVNDVLNQPGIMNAVKDFRLGLMGQPQGAKQDGSPYTFTDAMSRMRAQNATDPKNMQYLLNTVSTITDPKLGPEADKIRLNIARAAFDPANSKMMETANFAKDFRDPQTGKLVPGKYAAFRLFTSPAMTQQIARLDKQYPQYRLMENYKDWAEQQFGAQLFSKDIADLRDVQDTPWLKLHWDSDNNQFIAINTTASPVGGDNFSAGTRAGTIQSRRILDTIANINSGLRSMSEIEKANGGNVSMYLLQTLAHSGVDLSKNIDGLPQQMMKSIAATQVKDGQNFQQVLDRLQKGQSVTPFPQ